MDDKKSNGAEEYTHPILNTMEETSNLQISQYSAKRKKNANKTHYSMRYYPFETRFNRMGQSYGMSFSKRIEK
jgi:hypothetical protein